MKEKVKATIIFPDGTKADLDSPEAAKGMEKIVARMIPMQRSSMGRQSKCVEYLPCELTPDELKQYSELMADSWSAKLRAEEQLKSVSTTIKSEIQVAEGKINKCAELVNSKREWRNVECSVEWDFKKKIKKIVRVDTGELVKTHPISDQEMQEDLGVTANDK